MDTLNSFVEKARNLIAQKYEEVAEQHRKNGSHPGAVEMDNRALNVRSGTQESFASNLLAEALKKIDGLTKPVEVITDEMVETAARAAWLHFDTQLEEDEFQRAIRGDTSHLDEHFLEEWNYSVGRWPDNVGTHVGVEGFRKYARTALEAAQRFRDEL